MTDDPLKALRSFMEGIAFFTHGAGTAATIECNFCSGHVCVFYTLTDDDGASAGDVIDDYIRHLREEHPHIARKMTKGKT